MSVGPLAVEIICVFILSAYLLHRYGNWRKQHVVVTLATFVSWYFSFIIIFILPLDVSSTIYKQCIYDHEKREELTTAFPLNKSEYDVLYSSPSENKSTSLAVSNLLPTDVTTENSTLVLELTSIVRRDISKDCGRPWSYVPSSILPDMWIIVYWTSQILT
ncbi:G-protein coupled receptor-associated protein LMBRD2-like, partial [Saccoglossus kowalevskii]|uniref:LMBR1 domain-containing protein 2-like n=1 Tax=Saccoglossus kowalevskii TaxID=10224 RepID=A0ABM0GPJ1_SACKO